MEVKPNFGKTSFLYEAFENRDTDIPELVNDYESLLKTSTEPYPQESATNGQNSILKQDGLAFLTMWIIKIFV